MSEPPQKTGDDPTDGEPHDGPTASQMGGAPMVLGGNKMRARLAAAMFGTPSGGHEPHEPADGAAPTLIAGELATSSDALEESGVGDRFGRFRVLDRLGRGGMGVVYSAYDPQLDRKVAVKVLRPDVRQGLGAEAATARLLREAQAMAKISDPHVIAVHEVGTLNDRVFVAMEFIDGGTLGAWMAGRHSWREVLEVFVRAGSGLAAAHRGGLVHRDFKPENVLMGTDGRVRVVDFGLARSLLDDAVAEPAPRAAVEQPEHDSFTTPLTRTGAVMGTPAYMSPEQHLGRPATAQSDQFSFCVALWEALYGERPFRGSSLPELTGNVLEGTIREPPANVRVPRWINAALRRGLSTKPSLRFASMEALLTEIRRDPRRKWRLGALAVVGIGGAAFVGIGAYQRLLTGECDAMVESVDVAWSPTRRASVHHAIATAEIPSAERIAESTVKVLDDYVAQWRSKVQNGCGASQVGSKEARSNWKYQRLCFEDRLAEVDQLATQLGEGGPEMATTALEAATSISDVDACQDPQRLALWEAFGDPQAQERLAFARRRLVRASTAGALGRSQEAIEAATAVIEDARELNVPALEAAGLLVRGLNRMRAEQGDSKAEADLRLAVDRAKDAGDAATRAKALIQLGHFLSVEQTRYDEAFDVGQRARDAVQELGDAPLLGAHLDAMLGIAARHAGRSEEAIAYTRASLKVLRELVGDRHPDTIRALNGLGNTLCRNEQPQEGLAALHEALAATEAVLGGDHPTLFVVLQSLGVCLARAKRRPEGVAFLKRALEMYKKRPDADPQRILGFEYNIAFSYLLDGNDAEALRRARHGIPRAKALLAGRPTLLANWHKLLGTSLSRSGHYAEALAPLDDALAVLRNAGAARTVVAGVELEVARAIGGTDPARAIVVAAQLQREIARAPQGHFGGLGEDVDEFVGEMRALTQSHVGTRGPVGASPGDRR